MKPRYSRLLARQFASLLAAGLVLGACGAKYSSAPQKGLVTGYVRIFEGLRKDPRIGIPAPGRVTFKLLDGPSQTIVSRRSGYFSIELKPGQYLIFGGPASWHDKCLGNNGKQMTVRENRTIVVTVACVGY